MHVHMIMHDLSPLPQYIIAPMYQCMFMFMIMCMFIVFIKHKIDNLK